MPALEGLRPGKQIGKFTLKRFIARGGMGQVWEAEDANLRRRVALKLVLPERVDERSLALFAREARAGGRLSHPNLVTTLGHGTDGGLSWIAQELIDGSWTIKNSLDALRTEDVELLLVKNGDHRLSTDADIARLCATVETLCASLGAE